jgi:hypothetical protein
MNEPYIPYDASVHIDIRLHAKFSFEIVEEQLKNIIRKYPASRVRFLIFSNKRPLKCSGRLKGITRDFSSGRCNYKIVFKHFRSGKSYKFRVYIPFKNIRFIRNSNLLFKDIEQNAVLAPYFENHFESETRVHVNKSSSSLTKFSFL